MCACQAVAEIQHSRMVKWSSSSQELLTPVTAVTIASVGVTGRQNVKMGVDEQKRQFLSWLPCIRLLTLPEIG